MDHYGYDGNTVLGTSKVLYGDVIAVPASLTAPTRTGYTFGGWDELGTVGASDTSVSAKDFGIWNANTYTVQFNANGGVGNIDDMYVYSSGSRELHDCTFVRSGYKFVGWNTEADGSGTSYAENEDFYGISEREVEITLYAQWEKITS